MFDLVHGWFQLHRTHVVVNFGLAATSRWLRMSRAHIVVWLCDLPQLELPHLKRSLLGWQPWCPRLRVVNARQLLKLGNELLILTLLESNQLLEANDFSCQLMSSGLDVLDSCQVGQLAPVQPAQVVEPGMVV